jgi:hypothetical protein
MIRLSFFFVVLICTACVAAEVVIVIDGKTYRGTLQADAPAIQPASQPTTSPIVITPATQPTLPALTQRIAPAIGVRGDGYRIAASQTSAGGFCVDGFEQNIVVQDHPLPCTLSDFFSLRPHHPIPDVPGTYKGQCLYADKCGPLVVRGYYARSAGKWQGMPAKDNDRFRHAIYSNFGVQSLTVEDSWLDDATCAGIQSRGPVATIRRCFISECGIALLLVSGATVEDCTIYGGNVYHFPADPATGKPASWAGDVAIQAYYPVTLRNVWIVGKPGQSADNTSLAGLKTYHLGAVVSGGDYSKSEWKPPVGPDGKRIRKLVTATDCVIAGWPGPAFDGAAKHDGSGFTVKPTPVDVTAQIEAIRSDMEARRISVADAVARAQSVVRGAAK